MGEVKYWDGEDFTVLDSKDAQSVNGIKFRINVDILEYSNDGLTWSAPSNTALDSKVDNSRVLTDVPLNAKFTDTTYTAGDNISISGNKISAISGITTQLFSEEVYPDIETL